LLIHCRDAEEDCFEIMKEIVPQNYPIHRHCFTGSHMDALMWIDYFPNLKIGLTTGVLEPREYQVELLRDFPLERIIIETDSPYFLPRHCGWREYGGLDRNHPGLGYLVAAKLAEERNMDMEVILTTIRANTKALYGI